MSDIFTAMNKKIVVITGASSGLGKEIAKLYIQKNYQLIISGRNKNGLKEFRKENVDIIIGDLTNKKTIKKIVDLVINKHKKIDILINNAGIVYIQPIEANTKNQLDEIFEINVKSHMLLTQNFFPLMKRQQSGHIVNIISTAGKEGKLNHTMYCATKYAMSGFTESLRLEAKKYKIKVTGIYPGGMKTNIFNKIPQAIDKSTFMNAKNVAKAIVDITDLDNISPDSLVISRIETSTSSIYNLTDRCT